MELFESVFNKSSIYEMLFFNVKSVLIHPTLEDLEIKNKQLFDRWKYLANTKYNDVDNTQVCYEKNAPYFPEFSRIIAITYATLYSENGTLKRFFKKIVGEDEYIVIAQFMDVLYQISSDGVQSQPKSFPIFCGHNITSLDIPLLIKRFLLYREKFEANKKLPLILKNCLSSKPWESSVIDITNVWKFNGYEQATLMLIADYIGLKKTVELLPQNELSKYYWDNIIENPEKTLEFVALQSATQTNLVIQIMNELRQL